MAKVHSPGFLDIVDKARTHVQEISISELEKKFNDNDLFHLIDVRESEEWQQGHIQSAIHLSKGIIERDIEQQIADFDSAIVIYCSGGFRSILAAFNLQKMGYTNVYSLQGGSSAWLAQGGKLVSD